MNLSDATPKLGLDRMRALLDRLGNPQNHYRIFHVAGTNGKGSTCAYLDAMLGQAGIRRGLYTSPHLSCARERIRIDGEMISEAEWDACEAMVGGGGTFFERITMMAFLAFARAAVQVAVVEVGIGGRLDATNVVTPIVCGITQIALDHVDMLGATIEDVTREKMGIVKPGVPFVRWDECELPDDIVPGMQGAHQRQNAAVAWNMMKLSGLITDREVRKRGIENAKWPGRYETVSEDPIVILDGAHNPNGMNSLVNTIKTDARVNNKPIVLVIGMTTGHAHTEMVSELSRLSERVVTSYAAQAATSRALPMKDFASLLPNCITTSSVPDAVERAIEWARQIDAVVIVTGSLYVVGEARAIFIDVPCDPQMPAW